MSLYLHDLLKKEDPALYAKQASKGMMLAHPVKIAGETHRPDTGTHYHATIKVFNIQKDHPHAIHDLAQHLHLNPPDAKNTQIEPGQFKDKNGNDIYVIKLHGNSAAKLKEHHGKFAHMGDPESYEWQPHISASKELHDKIKASGAKTAHEAGIEFGHAELKQGTKTLKTYRHNHDTTEPVVPEQNDLKSDIQKSSGNLQFKNFPKVNSRPDAQIRPVRQIDASIQNPETSKLTGDPKKGFSTEVSSAIERNRTIGSMKNKQKRKLNQFRNQGVKEGGVNSAISDVLKQTKGSDHNYIGDLGKKGLFGNVKGMVMTYAGDKKPTGYADSQYKNLNSIKVHEAIHYALADLRNKYGYEQEDTNKIVDHFLKKMHPSDLSALHTHVVQNYNPNSSGFSEELLTHLATLGAKSNMDHETFGQLNGDTRAQRYLKNLGMEPSSVSPCIGRAKHAWSKIRNGFLKLTPKEVEQITGKKAKRQLKNKSRKVDKDHLSQISSVKKNETLALNKTEEHPFVSAAKKHFGVTNNIKEAGYIVPDGSMLDLSGRHYSQDHPSLKGHRNVDHRELPDEIGSGSGSERMVRFQGQTGTIRHKPESRGIDLTQMPTKEQLKTISTHYGRDKDPILVDITHPHTGENVKSFEVKPSFSALASAFHNHFHKNTKNINKTEQILKKSALKNAGIALGMAGALAGASHTVSAKQDLPTIEAPKPSYDHQKMLQAIAQVESGNGLNTHHAEGGGKIHGGEHAYGNYAVMPETVREIVAAHKDLRAKHNKVLALKGEQLHRYLDDNKGLDKEIAHRYLTHIEHVLGPNPDHISYAWLNGIQGAKKARNKGKDLSKHWYSKRVRDAYNKVK